MNGRVINMEAKLTAINNVIKMMSPQQHVVIAMETILFMK